MSYSSIPVDIHTLVNTKKLIDKLEQFDAVLVLIEIFFFPKRGAQERSLTNFTPWRKQSGRYFGYDNVGWKMQILLSLSSIYSYAVWVFYILI